jgi:hypothetical protein
MIVVIKYEKQTSISTRVDPRVLYKMGYNPTDCNPDGL